MELSCECGNKEDFSERTVVEFIVDAKGNREEKVLEETDYLCLNCKQLAEVCE